MVTLDDQFLAEGGEVAVENPQCLVGGVLLAVEAAVGLGGQLVGDKFFIHRFRDVVENFLPTGPEVVEPDVRVFARRLGGGIFGISRLGVTSGGLISGTGGFADLGGLGGGSQRHGRRESRRQNRTAANSPRSEEAGLHEAFRHEEIS